MDSKKIILTIKIMTLLVSLAIFYYIFEVQLVDAKLGYLELFEHNWNKGPIMNIVEGENGTCPENYEYLIDDYWPGTIDGCLCKSVFKGSCSSQISSSQKCIDIPSIDKFKFKLWRNKLLCALRLPTNYRNINNIRQMCLPQEKKCGLIDSLGNFLCIPIDFSCPINYINISNNSSQVNFSHFHQVNIVENISLIYSNTNTEGRILVEFRVSEKIPCADPDYENTGDNEVYILDKFYHRNKCFQGISGNKYDNRYNYLDTYEYSKLVIDSGLINELKKLPFFPYESNLNHSINLYTRNFIGFNISCLRVLEKKNVTMEDISKSIGYILLHFPKFKDYFWIWHLFIVFTTISFILILIFSIVQNIKKVVEKFLFTMFSLSFVFLCIGSFNLKRLCLNIFNNCKIIIPDVRCGDEYTNGAIENYITYLYELSRIILVLIYLKLIVLILIMCLICRNRFKKSSIIQNIIPENKYSELK